MVRRKRSRETRSAGGVVPAAAPVEAAAPPIPRAASVVTTEADARDLAQRLLTPGRRWPVAVVTVANGEREPFADVDDLVVALRGLVEVVVMPTSTVSRAFSDVMPPQTQVYGGASRVYPVDHAWVTAPRSAPLRFAFSVRERTAVTEHLIADGMVAAVAAGLYRTHVPVADYVASGTVLGVVGQRALVRLDDGSTATLWEELTGIHVPLARLVQAGQRLDGTVDPDTRRLDIGTPSAPTDGGRAYDAGDVVLAEVTSASPDELTLRPTYGRGVTVAREDVSANEHDRLDTLFAPGDVVVARVVGAAPLALSLLDVDDDEVPLPAPAILPGGPPWLVPPVQAEVVVAQDDAPEPGTTDDTAPVPVPVPAAVPASAPVRPGPPPEPPREVERPIPTHRAPTPLDVLLGHVRPGNARPGDVPPSDIRPSDAQPSSTQPGSTQPRDTQPGAGDLSAARVPPPASRPTPPHAPGTVAAAPSPPAERARVAQLEAELEQARGAADELVRMREYAAELERELAASERNRLAFRDKYRAADRARQQLDRRVKAAAAARVDDDTRSWFTDPGDALRFAVETAWASRVPAGEKARLPLGAWTVGPRFVDSLTALGPVSWRKLAEVVCDVVVGEPARLGALEHHELRQTASGNSPAVTRADGAVCYRVALQRSSPSARRLHYWRTGDVVELSRVVLHDDMAP